MIPCPRCPRCGRDTTVTETRSASNGARRRRICSDVQCGARVTTIELPIAAGRRYTDGPFVVARVADLAELETAVRAMLVRGG